MYHKRTEFFYLVGKRRRHLGEFIPLGRGYPLKPDPPGVDAEQFDEFFRGSKHSFSLDITVQVMAVTDVSARHKDAVRPLT